MSLYVILTTQEVSSKYLSPQQVVLEPMDSGVGKR